LKHFKRDLSVKRAFFIIIGFLFFPFMVHADLTFDQYSVALVTEEGENLNASGKKKNFVINGYTEIGKKSTAEDYEEEDTDNDYTYRNYHFKFKQKVSDRLTYDIGSFIYNKDYDSNDSLDNTTKLFKTNWSYYIKKFKEKSLKLDFRLNYKEKRYDNTPRSEYDQIRLAPTLTKKKKNIYSVDLTIGIDDYDYLVKGVKDQLKFFSKIGGKKYFLDKKLMIISSYKLEQSEKENINRKRTKQEVFGGFDYIFDIPLVYKVTTRAECGNRDTKYEEDRDEDYDYEYWRYYIKSEHKINPKLKTNFKYQFFKKDYISADLDQNGFYIQNNWDFKLLNDETQRVWFDLNFEHKDVEYTLKTNNDYKKEVVEIKITYKRKKNLPTSKAGWKVSAALEGNFYDFNDSSLPVGQESNDKKRYYAKLSGEKLFLNGDLVLSLDLKYRYTNEAQGNNKTQETVRLRFKYKF